MVGRGHGRCDGHSIASRFLVAVLIAGMCGAISIELIGTGRIADYETQLAWRLVGDPRPAVFQAFEADQRALVRLVVSDDPPRDGGYEADQRVQAAELEVGAALARLEHDCAEVTLVASRMTSADALGMVAAAVQLENLLYVRLGEVDQQQPASAPQLAEQEDEFRTVLQVEASQLAQFVVDVARDLRTR